MIDLFLQIVEKRGTLDGRFSNIRRINPIGGGGHFSIVFFARDDSTGREVVLKFFRPDRYTPADAYRWDSFEREPIMLAEMSGARDIIGLIAGRSEFIELLPTSIPNTNYPIRFAYYALEKAENDMEQIIATEKWSAEKLLLVFRGMVRSVQRIHARQIAHRDLKPSNFLIVDAAIKLSDFGTARSIRQGEPGLLPHYPFPPGDHRYCAPEMVACLHDVDPKIAFPADLFALGAILFEMFTGVNLVIQMFGPQLLTAVLAPLLVVPRDQRMAIFEQSISALGAGYPLPAIDSLSSNIPPCIRDRLDGLYKGLCNLDHRNRTSAFPTIFRGIDTCLLILRNEESYLRWLKQKQSRRATRMTKRTGASA